MIKISIIIPIYNVSQYVLRCLNSVMYQTYDRLMECLLVDDCGTDNSVQIVEDFIANYKGSIQFRLLHHDYNRGLSAARNTGLDAAVGEYVYFLDSDDELPTDALELLSEQLCKYGNVDLVQGFTQSFPMNSYYDLNDFIATPYVSNNNWIREHYYKLGKILPVNGVNKLIRRSFLLEHRLYFMEGIIHEDVHWMFYLVKYVSSIAFVFKPTYFRYYNEGSIMQTLNPLKEYHSFSKILLDWIDNTDEISIRGQLQIIISHYRRVIGYSRQKQEQLEHKIICKLNAEHLYSALFWFKLWQLLYPLKNIKRFLRYSSEAIK